MGLILLSGPIAFLESKPSNTNSNSHLGIPPALLLRKLISKQIPIKSCTFVWLFDGLDFMNPQESFCAFRHLIADPLQVVVSFDAILGWTLSHDDTNFSLAIRPRIAMRLIASLSRIMKVRAIPDNV